MPPDDRVRLFHIRDALQTIGRFVAGRSRADLDADDMLAFALMHAIQIVGEAANRISAETRARDGQIPWDVIVGMRHRLVHSYVDIDKDILWTTAKEAAPELLARILALLEESGPGPAGAGQ